MHFSHTQKGLTNIYGAHDFALNLKLLFLLSCPLSLNSKWDKVRSRVFAAKPATQDPNDASGTAAAATATATRPSGRRSSLSEGQRPRRRKTSGAKSAGGGNGKMSLMDACKSLLHNSKRDALGVGKVAPVVTEEGVAENVAPTASKDDTVPATTEVSAATPFDEGDDKTAGVIDGTLGGGAVHQGGPTDAGMSTAAPDAADAVAVAGTDKENVFADVVANPGMGVAAVPQSSRSALGECASSSRSASAGNIAETTDEVPVKYPPRFVTNLDTSKLRLRVEVRWLSTGQGHGAAWGLHVLVPHISFMPPAMFMSMCLSRHTIVPLLPSFTFAYVCMFVKVRAVRDTFRHLTCRYAVTFAVRMRCWYLSHLVDVICRTRRCSIPTHCTKNEIAAQDR